MKKLTIIKIGTRCLAGIKLERAVSKVATKTLNDWTVTIKPTCQKKELSLSCTQSEIDMHLHNIRTILLHSNATPIRSHGGFGYKCCFCEDQYLNAAELKNHTINKHGTTAISKFMNGILMHDYVVKLDITGLLCQICNENIDKLEDLVDHLMNEHHKKIFSEIKSHIIPFKFNSDVLKCVICSVNFVHFKLLQEHMKVHYRNYCCRICNAPFVNKRTLGSHMARHKQGEFPCTYCSKVFDTHPKKSNHEKFVHITKQKRNNCPYCEEKFLSYDSKNDHMIKEHGAQPLIFKCLACDKTFTRRGRLTRHTKRDHLLERRFECDHCDKKFYTKRHLRGHMVKHTGVKEYKCELCLKAFGRMYTLKEHMRIHADDRRFKCEHCGLAFVQKCSWKNHMRSKHGEYLHLAE